MKKQLLKADPQIIERYNYEVALIKAEEEASSAPTIGNTLPTISADDLKILEEYQKAEQEKEKRYSNFIEHGVLPENYFKSLSSNQLKTFLDYGTMLLLVKTYYPTIFEARDKSNISFDPDMHVWDSREVAEACNNEKI